MMQTKANIAAKICLANGFETYLLINRASTKYSFFAKSAVRFYRIFLIRSIGCCVKLHYNDGNFMSNILAGVRK